MATSPPSTLDLVLKAHNARIDAYHRKQAVYADARDEVIRLMVPLQPQQQHVMEKIDELLDELDTCFIELGHLDEGGRFDHEAFECMKIIRRIADGKIHTIDQVPDALQAEFTDAFEDEARMNGEHLIHGDWRRQTEVIEEQVEYCQEELESYVRPASGVNVREGFDQYLVGIKKVPEALELLMENLNNVWFDYKEAASDVGTHF